MKALKVTPDSDELKRQLQQYKQKYEEVEGKAYVHVETNDDNNNNASYNTSTTTIPVTTTTMNGINNNADKVSVIDTADSVDMKPVSTRNIYKDYSATTTATDSSLPQPRRDYETEFTALMTMNEMKQEGDIITTTIEDMSTFLHTQGYQAAGDRQSLLLSSGVYTIEAIQTPPPAVQEAPSSIPIINQSADALIQTEESFTRVMIIDEDDDSESEEDQDEDAIETDREAIDNNFIRVQITEGEYDSSDDEYDQNNYQPGEVDRTVTHTAGSDSFTRIHIQDDEDDDITTTNYNNALETNKTTLPSAKEAESIQTTPPLPPAIVTAATTVALAVELKEQGNKYMTQKDYVKAIDCYTQSITADPSLIASYNNRSLSYISLKVSAYLYYECWYCLLVIPVYVDI